MVDDSKTSHTMFLLLLVNFMLSGASCQFQIKTAISTAISNGTPSSGISPGLRIVSCSSSNSSDSSSSSNSSMNQISTLLIRTAYYLIAPTTSQFLHAQRKCTKQKKEACPVTAADVIIHGEKMTSADVIKLYRHCQGRSHRCDVGEAGVGKAFEITYTCLEGPFINPCSNTTSRQPADQTTLLFNYSRHSTDLDVACQCTLIPVTSSRNLLYIRALNLLEEETDDRHNGVQTVINSSGKFQIGEDRDIMEQPGPRVLIENTKWRWEVERRAFPVEWQLRMEENSSLSLLFHQMHGVSFGHLWMDLKGGGGAEREMLVSCSYTFQPGPPPTTTLPTKTPTSPQVSGMSGFLPIYLAVASSVVVILIVVVVVVLAKCKQRRLSSPLPRAKNVRIGPLPDDNKRAYNSDNMQLDGVYYTITEVSSIPSAQKYETSQSRDEKQPMNEETTFTNNEPQTRSEAKTGVEKAQNHQQATRQPHAKARDNVYGTLKHGPAAHAADLPRSEPVIYDHTVPVGVLGSTGHGSEYHCLQHCVSREPRVIDNIYDTTNVVKPYTHR